MKKQIFLNKHFLVISKLKRAVAFSHSTSPYSRQLPCQWPPRRGSTRKIFNCSNRSAPCRNWNGQWVRLTFSFHHAAHTHAWLRLHHRPTIHRRSVQKEQKWPHINLRPIGLTYSSLKSATSLPPPTPEDKAWHFYIHVSYALKEAARTRAKRRRPRTQAVRVRYYYECRYTRVWVDYSELMGAI